MVAPQVIKFLLFISFFISNIAYSKVVQILHTNDLHGFFKHYAHFPDRGGYGAVKSVIDEYKQWGADNDIETIYVDAGDFSEGNFYYSAQDGRRTFKMLEHLGVDIGVLGNHDYLMGTDALDKVLGDIGLNLPIMCANLSVDDKYTNIKKGIVPSVTKTFGDVKVAFMGVTTDSVLYTWRINNGKVSDPVKTGKKLAKKLSKTHDFVISVNHIGLKKDKKLAKKAKKYVDLIIGGHSHTTLKKPVWVKGKKGKKIAVVQAGKHGKYVGRILVDLVKGENLKVLKYELIPIEGIVKDEFIESLIADADEDLYEKWGESWLKTTVGFSKLPVTNNDDVNTSKITYQHFIADALRESITADIAINAAPMAGGYYPTGAVTRKDIINSYPRVFDFEDKLGWRVYKTRVNGQVLRTLLKWVMALGYDNKLYMSGISFKYIWKGKKRALIRKIRVNGEPLYANKFYTVALPEGIVRGGFAISKLTGLILKKSKRTEVPIWTALEDKLQRDGGVGPDYLNKQGLKSKTSGKLIERMIITPPEELFDAIELSSK